MGTSSSSQALVMPSITWENCHMMGGFSGLPKFKQLVAPMGRAPVQATLRAASATASVAVERHGQPALRSFHPDHPGVASGALHADELHVGFVLLGDPAFGADVGRGQHALKLHGQLALAQTNALGLFTRDGRIEA